MARGFYTEVRSAVAYPSAILGVPNITFVVMIFTYIAFAVFLRPIFDAFGLMLAAVPVVLIWAFVARRYVKDPNIENRWRTLSGLVFRSLPKGLAVPGRRLIPTVVAPRRKKRRGSA